MPFLSRGWLAAALLALAACGGDDATPGGAAGVAGAIGGAGGAGGASGGAAGAGAAGAAGEGGKTPLPPVQFRVATFNAENFFNDKADDPPPVPPEEVLSTSEYQAKLKAVAEILAKLNADLVMLEEIENDAILAALQSRPELAGKFVDRATFKGNDPRGIDIGALSAVPLTKKVSHKDDLFALAGTGGSDKYKFARDLLEVHADVNGRHMIFLGAHFKAKANDDPLKRLAEAQRARFVADTRRKEDPEAAVIILGDFNDFPGSDPINALQGAAPGEVYQSIGMQLDPSLAWSVYSQSAPNGKALHDDLRVSPWLFDRIVKGSIKIFHDTDLSATQKAASDHAPVVATFEIN